MRGHALLSPSGADRWLTCTPSARLTEGVHSTSVYADEGTLAHEMGELLIRDQLGLVTASQYAKKLKELQSHPLHTPAMFHHCYAYAAYVMKVLSWHRVRETGRKARIILEEQVDYSRFVPEGTGWVDVQIISDWRIDIIDLKYGAGVPVSADNNSQLKLYALGAVEQHGYICDATEVMMHIFQPRLDNNSNFSMSIDALYDWADNVVGPAAAKAWNGEGETVAGGHCRFCAIKATCRAFAKKNMELAKYEFKDSAQLSDEEITDILRKADMFKSWIKAVTEHVQNTALNGKQWPGFKLVAGRSDRKYTDQEAVKNRLLEGFFDEEQIVEKKVLGITKMEALLGKKLFAKYLGDLVIKPEGAPTLVPDSDPRPALNGKQSASTDFDDGYADSPYLDNTDYFS